MGVLRLWVGGCFGVVDECFEVVSVEVVGVLG